MEYLDDIEGDPSPGDYYLMQVAAEVRMIRDFLVGKPVNYKLGDFLIPFGRERLEVSPRKVERIGGFTYTERTPEEIAAMSARAKAMWGMRLGGKKVG